MRTLSGFGGVNGLSGLQKSTASHYCRCLLTTVSSDTAKDFLLGLWNGLEFVSPANSERIIGKIIEASKVVF